MPGLGRVSAPTSPPRHLSQAGLRIQCSPAGQPLVWHWVGQRVSGSILDPTSPEGSSPGDPIPGRSAVAHSQPREPPPRAQPRWSRRASLVEMPVPSVHGRRPTAAHLAGLSGRTGGASRTLPRSCSDRRPSVSLLQAVGGRRSWPVAAIPGPSPPPAPRRSAPHLGSSRLCPPPRARNPGSPRRDVTPRAPLCRLWWPPPPRACTHGTQSRPRPVPPGLAEASGPRAAASPARASSLPSMGGGRDSGHSCWIRSFLGTRQCQVTGERSPAWLGAWSTGCVLAGWHPPPPWLLQV